MFKSMVRGELAIGQAPDFVVFQPDRGDTLRNARRDIGQVAFTTIQCFRVVVVIVLNSGE